MSGEGFGLANTSNRWAQSPNDTNEQGMLDLAPQHPSLIRLHFNTIWSKHQINIGKHKPMSHDQYKAFGPHIQEPVQEPVEEVRELKFFKARHIPFRPYVVKDEKPKPSSFKLFKTSGEFAATATDPDYVIDGLLEHGVVLSPTKLTLAGQDRYRHAAVSPYRARERLRRTRNPTGQGGHVCRREPRADRPQNGSSAASISASRQRSLTKTFCSSIGH